MEEGWIDPAAWADAARAVEGGAGVVVIHEGDLPATCGCGRLLHWGLAVEGEPWKVRLLDADARAANAVLARCRCGTTHATAL
jgi:hypothetical protein